jgi:hypothetical protein
MIMVSYKGRDEVSTKGQGRRQHNTGAKTDEDAALMK